MVFAIFNSLTFSKLTFIRFLDERKPAKFMDFGYHIAAMCITFLWIHLWTFHKQQIDGVLSSMDIYEKHIVETVGGRNRGKSPVVQKIVKWVIWFEVIAVVVAFCKSIYSEELQQSEEYSLENVLLEKAEHVSMALMHWKTKLPGNETYNIYFDTYGRTLTPAGLAFGSIGLVSDFSERLLQISIRDSVLFLALTIYFIIKTFVQKIHGFANLHMEDVTEQDCHDIENYWGMYCKAKDVTLDVNWAFGALLKVSHVCNELFFVYFMSYFLDVETSNIMIIGMMYTICKFLCGYTLSALIHRYVSSGDSTQMYKNMRIVLSSKFMIIIEFCRIIHVQNG